MKLKFVDYDVEHKGYWNYGYQYWLSEERQKPSGKLESVVVLTTNDLKQIAEKIQELLSLGVNLDFLRNESWKKHRDILKLLENETTTNQ